MGDSLLDRFYSVPPITRSYVTGAIVVTASCSLELVSPFSLYFNLKLIVFKLQLWRLFTNFFFFGALGIDFLFHMFFLARYCRLLEEDYFRGRTADFALMLSFGGTLMCLASTVISAPPFLGSSLAFMMVYVWARQNKETRMSFLGLFTFKAPFLPWVLLVRALGAAATAHNKRMRLLTPLSLLAARIQGFSVLLGNSPSVDLMGIAVGHLYFFLDETFPTLNLKIIPGRGSRPLRAPPWLLEAISSMQERGIGALLWQPAGAGIGPVVQAAQMPLQQQGAAAAGGGGAADDELSDGWVMDDDRGEAHPHGD